MLKSVLLFNFFIILLSAFASVDAKEDRNAKIIDSGKAVLRVGSQTFFDFEVRDYYYNFLLYTCMYDDSLISSSIVSYFELEEDYFPTTAKAVNKRIQEIEQSKSKVLTKNELLLIAIIKKMVSFLDQQQIRVSDDLISLLPQLWKVNECQDPRKKIQPESLAQDFELYLKVESFISTRFSGTEEILTGSEKSDGNLKATPAAAANSKAFIEAIDKQVSHTLLANP